MQTNPTRVSVVVMELSSAIGERSEQPAKSHHQWTGKGQDYVVFRIKCGDCGMLLFEFVHRQEYQTSQARLMAIPDPNPSRGAASWYKPTVKVVCHGSSGGAHAFLPVGEGEDRNQVVTSEAWTRQQFEEWQKKEAQP